MHFIATSDLHFEVPRSAGPARELAAEICRSRADALILAGDIAAATKPGLMAESLALFAGFAGRKFLIAGNHDVWTVGGDADEVHAGLGAVCRDAGFHFLDDGPAVVGDVGVAGNMGWFDLAFRKPELGIPLRFYEAKIAPAAAAIIHEHAGLLAPDAGEAPSPRGRAVRARWMDGVRVRRRMSDAEFLDDCLARLERDLSALDARGVRAIVAAVHHLPFAELVPSLYMDDAHGFAAAYMGSPRIGGVLLAHPRVKVLVCGHSHRRTDATIGGIRCLNPGSSYEFKRVVEFDI